MPSRQGELARDPATRDGGGHRRRVPVTRQKTEHHTTTRTHQPRGSTHRFAQRRRRTNLHRTRGRLDASSRQPRGRATISLPPRSTGHHRCHLGSPRSAERHPQSSRDRGAHAGPLDLAFAAARAQRATRRFSGVKHADVCLTKILSRQRTLRGRRPW